MIEIFPKQTELKEDKPYGNLVKPPFGKHQQSGKFSYIITPNGKKLDGKESIELLELCKNNLSKIPEYTREIESELKQPPSVPPITKIDPCTAVKKCIEQGVPKGGDTLTKILGRSPTRQKIVTALKNLGHTLPEIMVELKSFNDKCTPPDDWSEVVKEAKKVFENTEYQAGCTPFESTCPCVGNWNTCSHLNEHNWGRQTIKNVPEFYTGHLAHIESLDEGLGLFGKEYKPIKKNLWYQTHSYPLQRSFVNTGNITLDLRYQVWDIVPSNKGKKELTLTRRLIGKELGLSTVSAVVSNAQQFAGTVKIIGKTTPRYISTPGLLNADILDLEEGRDFLTSTAPLHRESRSLLNRGMDNRLENPIEKQMTGVPLEEMLRFYPHGNITISLQPFKVGADLVLDGSLRRVNVPYIKFKNEKNTILDISRARLSGSGIDRREKFGPLIENLKRMQREANIARVVRPDGEEIHKIIRFEKDASEKIEYFFNSLIEMGLHHSTRGKEYIHLASNSILNDLLKKSGILAFARGCDKINVHDLECAFIDEFDLLWCKLNFVRDKMIGNLDYDTSISQIDDTISHLLSMLKTHGALSKEASSVQIKDFDTWITSKLGITMRYARAKRTEMSKAGLIKTNYTHNDSRVWLTPVGLSVLGGTGGRVEEGQVPSETTDEQVQAESGNGWRVYYSTLNKVKKYVELKRLDKDYETKNPKFHPVPLPPSSSGDSKEGSAPPISEGGNATLLSMLKSNFKEKFKYSEAESLALDKLGQESDYYMLFQDKIEELVKTRELRKISTGVYAFGDPK